MLDVRRLRVLREVSQRGSLAATAAALNYTPSAVSQQIAALEREAGAVLVERRSRGVRLTEAGRTLVEHAHLILAELAAAEASLAEIASLRAGRLRMASFATAGATLLPQAIATFWKRHPGVELSLDQADPEESVERLRAGDLDLALTVDVDARPSGEVEVIPLFEDVMNLVMARTHPLAAESALRLEDLAEETWIDVPPVFHARSLLTWACVQAGFEPKIAFASDEYAAIQELVAAGVGVALVPELALRGMHAGIVSRSLGPDGPRRRVQVAVRTPTYRSVAAEAMLRILREVRARRGVGPGEPA